MSVPKCRECEYVIGGPVPLIPLCQYKNRRSIEIKRLPKTSPLWCPLRAKREKGERG
jgi:hypothetical protein